MFTKNLKLALIAAFAMAAVIGAMLWSNVPASAQGGQYAVAVLKGTKGNEGISGVVHFREVAGGVEIEAHVNGLKPGKHGFHIHEFGDMTADDGTSMGSHFNPAGHVHADATAQQRHVGDLGNIEANASGHAMYKRVDTMVKLSGEHSVIGRGVVVHADPDDLTTQPTGNAGGRIAVGVIGIGKAQ